VKFVSMTLTGTADPTRASIPLHLAANGSLDVGHEVTVVLAGDATEIVLDDNAEKMEGVGVPPVRELLAKLKEHNVPVYV
jgi:predicted peroxiredoxin